MNKSVRSAHNPTRVWWGGSLPGTGIFKRRSCSSENLMAPLCLKRTFWWYQSSAHALPVWICTTAARTKTKENYFRRVRDSLGDSKINVRIKSSCPNPRAMLKGTRALRRDQTNAMECFLINLVQTPSCHIPFWLGRPTCDNCKPEAHTSHITLVTHHTSHVTHHTRDTHTHTEREIPPA